MLNIIWVSIVLELGGQHFHILCVQHTANVIYHTKLFFHFRFYSCIHFLCYIKHLSFGI